MTIDSTGRHLVIIGANGAGKSRFAACMSAELGDRAYSLSALDGLYRRDRRNYPQSSVGKLYAAAHISPSDGIDPDHRTELEELLAMLMHDELLNLISYKLAHAEGEDVGLQPTKLDSAIGMWQEVFPGNRILIESGKFLFSRDQDDDRYSAPKLSDGEQAVIYYIAGVLYAPADSVIMINSPEMFLHPTIMQSLWSRIEALRTDCMFVYTTHDLDFAASREGSTVIWVRNYDSSTSTWDYSSLENSGISDDVYKAIIGARKPVLFIEGDGVHSIDSKLYPLIFRDFTVKSLGSCNKVIEATRTFNDLNTLHHMDSCGIVDRDRRDTHEVEYLRGKRVMVPEVAEIENIMMLEEVIRAVAHSQGRNEDRVFDKVRAAIISQFSHDLKQQALLHTRHRMKRAVEYRIDGRFTNINMLEEHIQNLYEEIQPRRTYEQLCTEFRRYVKDRDYASVLKVYNQKSMIPGSNVASMCGLKNKEEYISTVIDILRRETVDASRIRRAVMSCFGLVDGKCQNPI